MQNYLPMMIQRWKSKPEIEFQHDRRLFFETGSSNLAARDWDISPKFGLQLDFDFLKWANSRKTNPKVELRCRDRHLEKLIWRHNYVGDGLLWTKFGRQLLNGMPMTTQTWKSKPEVEFQHGGRRLSVFVFRDRK